MAFAAMRRTPFRHGKYAKVVRILVCGRVKKKKKKRVCD